MPGQPPITQEWRDYDRRQRRRILLGTAAVVTMIAAAIAVPMCAAYAEFGSNADRGYGPGASNDVSGDSGGDRYVDEFGDPVSGGSPRDYQPFGARSGGGQGPSGKGGYGGFGGGGDN